MSLLPLVLLLAATDPFGIRMLFPTRPQGVTYYATSWANQQPRTFLDSVDPLDPWFDAGHGSGRYAIDGHGTLSASGDYVRMYVHHPNRKTEWGENLEITAYLTRVSESRRLDYSGPQIFARTNHGTFTGAFDGEEETPCDDRGVGAKINLGGTWAFEKETRHGGDGYATAGARKHWAAGFPVGVAIGVKYVVRNVLNGAGRIIAVTVALYVDTTRGAAGGTWVKVTEYTDAGKTWGVGKAACAPGADPAALPVRSRLLVHSETKRPELSVYFRHEFGTMKYQRLSVREIDPVRASPTSAAEPAEFPEP